MFSKSCEYGIRAVLFLSTNSDEEHKLGVSEMAEKLKIPKHFLAKILQQLSRNNLVSSTKGPNGGFYMSDYNQKSNLLKVIECIDGPDIFNTCILGLDECSNRNPCTFHDKVENYRKQMLMILEKDSIIETAENIKLNNFKI